MATYNIEPVPLYCTAPIPDMDGNSWATWDTCCVDEMHRINMVLSWLDPSDLQEWDLWLSWIYETVMLYTTVELLRWVSRGITHLPVT